MPQIRIFHCDDSAAFTRLVAHWLDEHGDIEHVGAAHTGDDAIAAIGPSQPDVVLLDTMGSPGDTALLRRIRTAAPRARVIVYSGYVSLLDEGALGATISGAGPSVLFWTHYETTGPVMAKLKPATAGWAQVLHVPFEPQGAYVREL